MSPANLVFASTQTLAPPFSFGTHQSLAIPVSEEKVHKLQINSIECTTLYTNQIC